jgi:hypothetical protein
MMLILAAAQGLYAIGMGSFANSDFAASYGKSACIYASQVECAQAYADIFYSPGAGPSASADNLSGVFLAIGPVTAMRMLFLALRAGLNSACCPALHAPSAPPRPRTVPRALRATVTRTAPTWT